MTRSLRVLALSALLLARGDSARPAFWEVTAGPCGGYVRSLLALSADTLLAGTYFGGVYRSTDGGTQWVPSSTGLGDLHVHALAQAPGGALYAGTFGGGVCRSVDRGLSWTPVNDGLTRLQVWCLAAPGADTLYAGTYQGGVFRSLDGGASWSAASAGLATSAALDVRSLAVHPDGRLFAGTYDYVYRSADAGGSWTQVRTGLGNTYCWALAARADGLLAVGTPNGCWLSADGGGTWIASGLSVNTSVMTLDSRADGQLFAGCGSGVWWSADDGASWSQRNSGLTSTDVACVRAGAGATVLAGTARGGAFRSDDDGLTWRAASTGIQETHVAALMAQAGGAWFAGSEGGVFRSDDLGSSWALTALTNRNVVALAGAGADMLAATAGWGVFHSSDGGLTWGAAGSGLADANAWALAPRPAGGAFVGTSTGVSRLTSYGGAWESLAGFPASIGVASLLAGSSGHVYAGTLNDGLFRSPDDGATWTQMSTGLGTQRILALAEDRAGRLFAGTMSNGVYRSLDQGASWQQLTGTSGYVCALTVDSEDAVFAAQRGAAVLRSLDHGDSWAAPGDGLGGYDVIALARDSSDRLLAGTDHHGAYRSVLPTTGVAPGDAGRAPGLLAWPNPSRSVTRLGFALPRPARTRVEVFDVAGRRVRLLLDGTLPAGGQSLAWDGSDDLGRRVPSGLYLARVVAGRDGRVVRLVRCE